MTQNKMVRESLIGGFSFDGDSFPECSELDTTSEVIAYKSERKLSDGRLAPMTIIETITITRPIKVIAFICGMLVVILMVMALTSTDWLMAQGWRQGLFFHCIDASAERPLPFGLAAEQGCFRARDVGYIRATAALCIITLFTDAFATLLTGLGLRSEDPEKKYKYYRLAVYIMVLALVSILIALVIYPVCFADELAAGNRLLWEFGWAYGVGWGACIFLFGAVVLLLCDKESEEIYYKERDIIQEQHFEEKA